MNINSSKIFIYIHLYLGPSTPRKSGGGVNYFYHFPKDFLVPYGKAFKDNAFSKPNLMKVLKPINCELLSRPTIGMSELCETILVNVQYIEDEYEDFMSVLPRYLKKIKSIKSQLQIMDNHNETQGNIRLYNMSIYLYMRVCIYIYLICRIQELHVIAFSNIL